MQSRRSQGPLPRPNELSDMGRINAAPQVRPAGPGATRSRRRVMAPNVAPATRTVTGVTPSGLGASRVFPRILLAVVGGMIWFGATTASEMVDGGAEFDLWLFVGTLIVTAIIGAVAGRSWGDDVALGIGAVVGLALSGLLMVSRPEGQTSGDLVQLAVVIVTLIVLLAGGFRSIARRVVRT